MVLPCSPRDYRKIPLPVKLPCFFPRLARKAVVAVVVVVVVMVVVVMLVV